MTEQNQQDTQSQQQNLNIQNIPNQTSGQNETQGNIFTSGKEIGGFDQSDIEQNKAMAGLSYFIFFLPLIACPNSKFAKFHANQSLLLVLSIIALNIATAVLSAIIVAISWRLFFLSGLLYTVVNITLGVFGIMGLINGFGGKAKELPIIGKLRIIK